jgi:hypothetical protein
VGAARALGARSLLPASADRHRHLWLANTDADSAVLAHWLTHMIEDAHRGADLILGTVEPDATASPRLRHTWNVRHVAEDGHPHVHGANLGIRSSAYLALGGWAYDASGEDASLVRAAAADGTVRTLRRGAIPMASRAACQPWSRADGGSSGAERGSGRARADETSRAWRGYLGACQPESMIANRRRGSAAVI